MAPSPPSSSRPHPLEKQKEEDYDDDDDIGDDDDDGDDDEGRGLPFLPRCVFLRHRVPIRPYSFLLPEQERTPPMSRVRAAAVAPR